MPKSFNRELRIVENSDELCKQGSEASQGKVVLSFSGGKDSLGCWIQLKRYFSEIVPVYMYLIPGLEFTERMLDKYERHFGTHIIRLPHPSLYRMLNGLVSQPPQHYQVLVDHTLPVFDYDDVFSLSKYAVGFDQDTLTAVGVRATDSLNRWTSIKQYGAWNVERATFYPIYDWSKDRLINELWEAGVTLPEEYRWFGRSFDGIDFRFLKGMKENAPKDYGRLLEWIPLADMELYRLQYRQDFYDRGGDTQ